MNQDIFEGKWKQVKGSVKIWWNKLTDDDVEVIQGRMEKLVGLLQERYGWAREKAEAEVRDRMRGYEAQPQH